MRYPEFLERAVSEGRREVRDARLMNAFGRCDAIDHTTANPGCTCVSNDWVGEGFGLTPRWTSPGRPYGKETDRRGICRGCNIRLPATKKCPNCY